MVQTIKDLQGPDVILLNEMDIGMARSNNLHTTRMLAFTLKMNYAWGLEFVELTRGTKEEQEATNGTENSLGLHGNAILSKCKMYDPLVIRDKLDPIYFSNETHWMNANGYEKRLGGRMGMFVRLESAAGRAKSSSAIAGSVHKVGSSHRKQVFEYFGFDEPPVNIPRVLQFSDLPKSDNGTFRSIDFRKGPNDLLGIVVGGDFGNKFCPQYGLHNPDVLHSAGPKKTFKASCLKSSTGGFRGDWFCSNMPPVREDKVFLPCSRDHDDHENNNKTVLQLSDHAILQIDLRTD